MHERCLIAVWFSNSKEIIEDSTLNIKQSCVELSLLMKRGLETLSRSWNHSQRSSRWSFLMITKESSLQVESHVEEVSLEWIIVLSWKKLSRKMLKNRPQLLVAEPLILHDKFRSLIADVVTKKLREIMHGHPQQMIFILRFIILVYTVLRYGSKTR